MFPLLLVFAAGAAVALALTRKSGTPAPAPAIVLAPGQTSPADLQIVNDVTLDLMSLVKKLMDTPADLDGRVTVMHQPDRILVDLSHFVPAEALKLGAKIPATAKGYTFILKMPTGTAAPTLAKAAGVGATAADLVGHRYRTPAGKTVVVSQVYFKNGLDYLVLDEVVSTLTHRLSALQAALTRGIINPVKNPITQNLVTYPNVLGFRYRPIDYDDTQYVVTGQFNESGVPMVLVDRVCQSVTLSVPALAREIRETSLRGLPRPQLTA
jgi:hypothetical protein